MTITDTPRRTPYTGNGVTTDFAVPFPFFEIEVYGDDPATPLASDGSVYTVSQVTEGGPGTVTFLVAPEAASSIVIVGATKVVQESDYVDAADFPAEVFEDNLDRLTMIAQEAVEASQLGVRGLVSQGSFPALDFLNNQGTVLTVDGTGKPVLQTPDQVLTGSITSALAARDAAIAAQGLAENAQSYAEEWAQAAEDTPVSVAAGGDGATDFSSLHHAAKSDEARGYSEEWAVELEDTPVSVAAGGDGTTDFSSLHHAAKSAASATASAASASASATSETNAGNSATAAATSETNAGNSATAAATSETNAGTSETNAAASAAAALASETNAAASATAAAGSATAAGTSETNAAASATAAGTSETNAAASATAAGTSETNAAASATAAAGYALDIEKDDVEVVAGAAKLNFEGTGVASVVDDGGGKVTVTLEGGAAGFVPFANRASIAMSVADSCPTSPTQTTLDWQTEVEDIGGWYDAGASTRLTVPAGITAVLVSAILKLSGPAGSNGTIWLQHNDSSGTRKGDYFDGFNFNLQYTGGFNSPPIAVAAGDYFELIVIQNSGATRTTDTGVCVFTIAGIA